jgi:long-chain acyl-CoA synthetase
VVVRGDVVMAGYWNQPDATAEALRGGWLHTGDVGSFDADGYLTLRDRSKDLIISGGMNIYPREVERRCSTTPASGRWPWSAGPIRSGARRWWPSWCPPTAPPRPRSTSSTATCLDRIARFKRPRDYRFVDALPTNNYGKVVKRELHDQL